MDSVKSKKAKTPVVQKTPKSAKKNDKSVNKTPLPKNDTPRPPKKQNGVQTPNKKGNATPKKTPKTDPKKKKTLPKKVEESEDDDDDEEDDSEIELNPEIMKKLSEVQDDDDEDMEDDDEAEEEDDDDEAEEDDDDDEEEDDDDDDDDDDESELDEEELKKLIQSLKGKKSKKEASTESPKAKGDKTPKPEAKKPVIKEFPKPKQPKEADKVDNVDKDDVPATEVDKNDYLKSVKERDCRTLFMKGLPIDIKEETLLKLSKDIQSVRIRKRARKDEKRTLCYAFLEFASEAKAEENFKVLSETKIDGKTIMVDYTGEKSIGRPPKKRIVKELDPIKLYITGFPSSTTEIELKQLIPKAETVTLPIKRAENKPLGFAFAKFDDPLVCSQELKRLHGKSFKDCTLVVLHANLMRKPKEATKRKSDDVKGKAKKIKLDKSKKAKKEEKKEEKMEEEDDDDDDEDDDEEDDSDEE